MPAPMMAMEGGPLGSGLARPEAVPAKEPGMPLCGPGDIALMTGGMSRPAAAKVDFFKKPLRLCARRCLSRVASAKAFCNKRVNGLRAIAIFLKSCRGLFRMVQEGPRSSSERHSVAPSCP